jgi:WD40 repeat protein
VAEQTGGDPVAEFCAGLRRLQQGSGLDRAALARRLGYSRSQLYEILDGRITRPPDWDRLVEPLVRVCTGNDQHVVEVWRQRYDVLVEVHHALRRQDNRRPRSTGAMASVLPPCPYRGLSAFREQDAALFFGREELTDRLVSELEHRPLVALVGPSGSGKSSLVFAGAVARLRRGGWAVADLRPDMGASPLSALAAALLPLLEPDMTEMGRLLEIGKLEEALIQRGLAEVTDHVLRRQGLQRLLLVVDQFEELYARDPAVADQFVDVLVDAMAAKHERGSFSLTVVLTLRADFLGQALEHAELAEILQDSTLVIGRMTRTQLRRAIEGPLPEQVRYEPGLVERILADVGEEAGHLALLEFALTALWEHQQDHVLAHAAYAELGAVTGALARYAEQVYHHDLHACEQGAARLFVQLVRPDGLTEPTRRVARRGELDASLWPVVQRLAATRLVVTGRDDAGVETVELAHEALIAGWDRLRQWVEADRDFRNWQERLRTELQQYEASGRDPGALLRGVSLAEAQRWLGERRADIGAAEQDYIQASRALQGRTVRRLQTLVAGLIVLLLVAITLGISIDRQRRHVAQQERLATSRALAAQADATIDDRPVESILLSLQAFTEADTAEARASLLRHLLEHSQTKGFLVGHRGRVSGVAFSPDGRTLVTGGVDTTVRLWDVVAHRELATLTGHTDRVRGVAFSPRDGRTLATVGDDATVRLWDIAARRELATLTGHTGRVIGVAFSPDGRTLATGGDDAVRLWDVVSHRELATLPGHTNTVRAVAFSPDGRILATGSDDATVRLWDVVSHRELAALTGHTDIVLGVAFSPDGRLLATGSDDRTVRLWDVATRRGLATLTGHSDAVTNVDFWPDGRTLATASRDNTVRVWDVTQRYTLTTYTGHVDWLAGVAFSPDGRTLATASQDNTVRLRDVKARQELAILTGHNDRVSGAAFSPDGHTLVTGGVDATVRLWDAVAHRELAILTGHNDKVRAVAFSSDGRMLASASDDRTVRLWDVATRRELAMLTGHNHNVWGVAFSSDGRMLATASFDRTVRLWDVATRRELAMLTGHNDKVRGVAFSPDGRTLASASDDRTVRLWDVATRRELAMLTGHNGGVLAVAFSPDGRNLATGSQDATVRLWDVATRHELATLTGHTGWVYGIAFSSDSRTLASGSDDRTVRLWDVPTRRQLATLSSHTGWVLAVAFSPDGHTLATASQDRTARLWDVHVPSWQRRLCTLASRNLTPQEWNEFLPQRTYQKTCPDQP